jgi:hypothetical protein
MKNVVFWDVLCVDPALTDVSEEHIAFIFRVVKFASGEKSVSSCLHTEHQSETTSYVTLGREGV